MSTRVAAWTHWPMPAAGVDMWDWQDGRCAWCGIEATTQRLAEDHCHRTGLVRGYLCRGCNLDEGRSDDPAWDEWRAGDNPANALKEFRIYRNSAGRTTIDSQSILGWYSHEERLAWFELVIPHLESGGAWPAEAPPLDTALARRDAANDHLNAVVSRLFSGLFDKGAAS